MPAAQDYAAPVRVQLRGVVRDDLPALYVQQLDPEANRVAVANPRDATAFDAHWTRVLSDPRVVVRTILADGEVVGYVSCFPMDGRDSVGYWIARSHWGRGIATQALALLLGEVALRPLFARVARDNAASLRVLQRCGFTITGYQHAPATERFPACDEALLELR